MNKFVSVKEIADALQISPKTVFRRLHDFGLDKCRDRNCKKPIRFFKAAAERALRMKGFLQ